MPRLLETINKDKYNDNDNANDICKDKYIYHNSCIFFVKLHYYQNRAQWLSSSLPFLEPFPSAWSLTLSFLLFRISQLCVQRAVFSFPPLLHPPTVRRCPIPGWMMTPCLNFFGHSNQSSISLKSLILKTPPF